MRSKCSRVVRGGKSGDNCPSHRLQDRQRDAPSCRRLRVDRDQISSQMVWGTAGHPHTRESALYELRGSMELPEIPASVLVSDPPRGQESRFALGKSERACSGVFARSTSSCLFCSDLPAEFARSYRLEPKCRANAERSTTTRRRSNRSATTSSATNLSVIAAARVPGHAMRI